jgi:DNA-binding beta-propeller fold protein YncE
MLKVRSFQIRIFILVTVVLAVIGTLVAVSASTNSSKGTSPTTTVVASTTNTTTQTTNAKTPLLPQPPANAPSYLQPGSNPSALPSDLLIAENYGSQLLIVNPQGQIVWQFPPAGSSFQLKYPDDAFFSPDGRYIIVTQEDYQKISLISIAQDKVVWTYGTPDTPGSAPEQLDNPDDALILPNGNILSADIKNCSIVILSKTQQYPLERIGILTHNCYHNPPYRFGSPNGVFPLNNGNYLVTEINGDWVDEMTTSGKILWSTHPPGVYYPSDTNEVAPNLYITADYSDPGQIVEFNKQGKLIWRYGPRSGPGALNTPSLCEVIPTNGYVICNDDSNNRVIVINPQTNQIVWQYGVTSVASTAPGYLNHPDGLDLAPPYSLLSRHFSTMGNFPQPCSPSNPLGTCTYNQQSVAGG